MISVIVAVYQAESYLPRCVDSILAQTYKDFELLLVDDGSTDNSALICEEYAKFDKRIKVFHKKNEGLSSTRQFGMEHSCGEYTIHCDPDDWIESNMLEEMYIKAQESDSDIVMCDVMMEYENESRVSKQYTPDLDAESLMKVIYYPISASVCNKLIKRDCYTRYGAHFDKEVEYGEDLYVMLQFLRYPVKVNYIPKAFYHYDRYSNKGGLSINLKMDKLKRSTDYFVANFQDCPAIKKLKINVVQLAHRYETTHFREYDNLYPEINFELLKIGISHPIIEWRSLVIALQRFHLVRISMAYTNFIEWSKRVKASLLPNVRLFSK